MSDYLKKRREEKTFGKTPAPKKNYAIPKKSAKKIAQEKAEKERLGGDDTDLVKWYKARIKQMSGRCAETGLLTETKIYAYAIMSICHILPKENCKSVMYHPLNFIELNCDFHKKFDAMSWEEREQLGCWPIIFERLCVVANDISREEYRHLPDSVKKWMEDNYPFPEENPYSGL